MMHLDRWILSVTAAETVSELKYSFDIATVLHGVRFFSQIMLHPLELQRQEISTMLFFGRRLVECIVASKQKERSM